jgi:hypothetical protein
MRDPSWRDVKKMNENLTWRDQLKVFFLSKTTVMNNVTQACDIQIANARLPYNASKEPLPVPSDPYTPYLTPDYSDLARWGFARNDAANAMWLIALALHSHKLERKTYPQNLRVLVPRYLKEIPADPFGGDEPLRYKLAGNSYLLWSIGPDERDNSGVAIRHAKDATAFQLKRLPTIKADSKGDYVWGKNQ